MFDISLRREMGSQIIANRFADSRVRNLFVDLRQNRICLGERLGSRFDIAFGGLGGAIQLALQISKHPRQALRLVRIGPKTLRQSSN
jgi:hypothetical protein